MKKVPFTIQVGSFKDKSKAEKIVETIEETESFFSELEKLNDKESENRIDVLSSYGVYRFNKGTKKINRLP